MADDPQKPPTASGNCPGWYWTQEPDCWPVALLGADDLAAGHNSLAGTDVGLVVGWEFDVGWATK